ncbi:hypothetical protein Bra471DRAFT_07174 [Bradyrhizobium sp. WSM471]|nr:hypothetical protein Bra471DRAFT_07174 [Bradyrhizobium sp. WSM471]
MRWKLASALALGAGLLGGCSNIDRFDIPTDPNTGSPTPASIITRFKCELAAIAADDYRFKAFMDANDFVVGVQLDLSVTDDGSLAPSFTYTNGLFSFNAGAKLELSRAQTFTERVFLSVADIRIQSDGKLPNDPKHPRPTLDCPKFNTLLAGDLGVRQTVEMAMVTPDLALTSSKLTGSTGAFGGSVNFIVTKNLNGVGPTWTLTHFKGPGSLAGVSEVNNDKITFAFAARKATDGIPPAAKVDRFLDSLINSSISTNISNLKPTQ